MAEQTNVGAPIRALYAALNQQDADAFDQIMDEKAELFDFSFNESFRGREEIKKYFRNWWTAFPQGTGEIKNMTVADGQVVVETIGRGEQTGLFELKEAQFKPTHQNLEFHFVQVCHMKNGKIERIHSYSDAFRVLTSAADTRRAAA